MIGADTGGTFTDFIALDSEGALHVAKVPSTPADPARSFLDGLAEIADRASGGSAIVHGCTVATNAVLEGKGARTALITTYGLEDVIEIGRQTRPVLYDLTVRRPAPLVPRELRFGVRERVTAEGEAVQALEQDDLDALVRRIVDADVESVAVVCLFSFLHPEHEERIGAALRGALSPDTPVSLSSRILPAFREYERTSTTVLNAYVAPIMGRYLNRLDAAVDREVRIMASSGGSLSMTQAREAPVHTLLSGPAGGVAGAFAVAETAGIDRIITLDMGGTSTDVALCDGDVSRTSEGGIGGFPVRVPMVDIHTVGAGGGSIAHVDAGGALAVGPQSAGARPGPAAYGMGGGPTVTDANLVLGRLPAERPLAGRMPLDARDATDALGGIGNSLGTDAAQAARGVLRVANATMERALRAVSLERGYDPREFTLVAFGGAGPLHACELAEGLGIGRVLVPRYPGVLSALGMLTADVTRDDMRTLPTRDGNVTRASLAPLLTEMEETARADLVGASRAESELVFEASVDLRYRGQGYELTVPLDAPDGPDAVQRFHVEHQRRFGHRHDDWPVEPVALRLRTIVRMPKLALGTGADGGPDPAAAQLQETPLITEDGQTIVPLYNREALRPGNRIQGPAVLTQTDATTYVPDGWSGHVDVAGNILLTGNGE